MRKINYQSITGIITILFILLGVTIVVYWELYGREVLAYKEVVVAKVDITKGMKIDENVLTIIKTEESKIISNAIFDSKKLLDKGLAAKQFIPKNSQLNFEFFDTAEVVLKDNQKVFKVPNDWIVSIPSSIRRKDTAYFYEVHSKINHKIENSIAINGEKTSTPSDGNSTIDTYNTNVTSTNSVLSAVKVSSKPILKTAVGYVKDNSNREVVTLSKEDRYDGSSQVYSLEIIATDEEFRLLEDSIKKGFKFIVMYN